MALFKTPCDLEGYNGSVCTQTNKPSTPQFNLTVEQRVRETKREGDKTNQAWQLQTSSRLTTLNLSFVIAYAK